MPTTPQSERLIIRYRKIEELNLAEYNPRDITQAAIAGLRASVTKWGMIDPVIVNVRDGKDVVVGGHQRIKVAQELGWDEVPTVDVSLSPTEERALNVTLNNHHIAGHFTDSLQDLLEEIRSDMMDEIEPEEVDEFFETFRFDELVLPEPVAPGNSASTGDGTGDAFATIKVRCPQAIRDEVSIFLKGRILETSFEGVEVI